MKLRADSIPLVEGGEPTLWASQTAHRMVKVQVRMLIRHREQPNVFQRRDARHSASNADGLDQSRGLSRQDIVISARAHELLRPNCGGQRRSARTVSEQ